MGARVIGWMRVGSCFKRRMLLLFVGMSLDSYLHGSRTFTRENPIPLGIKEKIDVSFGSWRVKLRACRCTVVCLGLVF